MGLQALSGILAICEGVDERERCARTPFHFLHNFKDKQLANSSLRLAAEGVD